MKKNYFNYTNNNFLNFILISLMIITYPFNFKVILFFRIVDFISLIFILLNLNKIQATQIKLITMVIVALMISSLVGFYYNPNIQYIGIYKLVYVYKYLIPLIIFFILINLKFDNKSLKIFYRLLFFSYLILIFYNPFIELFDVSKLISTYHFPLTYLSTNKGDKHVLGATISFLTFFIILYRNLTLKKKILVFDKFTLFIMILSTLCGFYISSITLILSCFICFSYIMFFQIQYLFYTKKLIVHFRIFLILLFFIFVATSIYFVWINSNFLNLLINYSIIDLARFNNIFYNFPSNVPLLLFGSGLITSPLFIDQGFLTLIHSFGLIPTGIFLYFFFSSKSYSNLNLDCKFFIYIIFLENLFITEFFLLSRYILPLIIFYVVYFKSELNFGNIVINKYNIK